MAFTIKGKISLPKGYDSFTDFYVQAFYLNAEGEYENFQGAPENNTAIASDGSFSITTEITNVDFSSSSYFYKIYVNEKLIKATKPEKFNDRFVPPNDISFERTIIDTSSDYIVKGRVINNDRGVYSGYVKAFDHHSGLKTELTSEFIAINNGDYSISYTPGDKGIVNLTVEVYREDNSTSFEMSSPLFIEAKQVQVINLKVGNEEYIGDTVFNKVDLKLGNSELDPLTWTKKEVKVEEIETDLEENQIINYAKAKDLSNTISGSGSTYQELLYGLLDRGHISSERDIASIYTSLEDFVSDAESNNAISATASAQLASFKESFKNSIATKERASSNSTIAKLFPSDPSYSNSKNYVELSLKHRSVDDFINNVNTKFSGDDEKRIKNSIRISQIASGEKKLIEALTPDATYGKDDYDFILEDITLKTHDNWKTLLTSQYTTIPGFVKSVTGSPTVTMDDYASHVMNKCEKAFPTEFCVIQHTKDLPEAAVFKQFLQYNKNNGKDINIRSSNFDISSTTWVNELFSNVPAGDKSFISGELKKLQRLYPLMPSENKSDTISKILSIEDGSQNPLYPSAVSIASAGMDKFKADLTAAFVPEAECIMIYNRAVKSGVKVMNRLISHSPTFNGLKTRAFGTVRPQTNSNIPNLEDLFKEGSYCSCKHCNSVFGPSAYLVDTLQFLSEIENLSNLTNPTNLQLELFSRRPDIEVTNLNCKNTNTPIPYVDLVNEVLEDFIHPPTTTDHYNTAKSEEQISTYPENLNTGAYTTIQGANYPWNLPFNLFDEEIRGYLRFVNVPKYEILKYFSTSDLIDLHLAYLNISKDLYNESSRLKNSASNQTETSVFYNQHIFTFDTPDDHIDLDVFLDNSCIDLEMLKSLLDSKFINPLGAVQIEYGEPPCSLSAAKLNNMSIAVLDKIHRFTRLKNILNWTVAQTDMLVSKVSSGDFGDILIAQIYSVMKLSKLLKISIEDAIALKYDLSEISYGGDLSQFDRIFQNPLQPTFSVGGPYSLDWYPHLQAALGIDADTLRSIIFKLFYDAPWSMTKANLSSIYRVSVICKTLNLTAQDFYRYCSIMDISEPLGLNSNNEFKLIEIVEKINRIQQSNFSITDLEYLLLNNVSNESDLIADEDDLLALLTELHEKRKEFEMSFPPVDVNNVEEVKIPKELPYSIIKLITLHFGSDESLVYELLSNQLELYFTRTITIWVDGVQTETQTTVLKDTKLLDIFLSEDFFNLETVLNNDTFFKTLVLLNKALALVSKLGLSISDIPVYFNIVNDEVEYDVNWTNLNDVPIDTTPAASSEIFNSWYNLNGITSLSNNYFKGEVSLFEIIESTNNGDNNNYGECLDEISPTTGWDKNDLYSWAVSCSKNTKAIYQEFATYELLINAISIINKIKVPASTIIIWTGADESAIATSIRLSVKSHYSNDAWVKIAGPLRSELREKQQEALCAYLINNVSSPAFRDKNDIYDYFLLDPEMSACAKTTRIKQAGLSVQLLMQRTEMNLEADYTLTPTQVEEWEWMKNYRVWEANRKVFLYPENWLEPEFRMVKSPICKELEEGIIQDEINEDNVSKQYFDYVDKLNEIGNLEPVSIYVEEEDNQNVVHVIARTRKSPSKHFYRKFINNLYWTPWEQITIDIESEQIVPAFWNNKLYLFWPVVSEKQVPTNETEYKETKKHREITLYWTSYSNGRWNGKQKMKNNLGYNYHSSYTTDNGASDDVILWSKAQLDEIEVYIGVKNWYISKIENVVKVTFSKSERLTSQDLIKDGNTPVGYKFKISPHINIEYGKFVPSNSEIHYMNFNVENFRVFNHGGEKIEFVIPLQYTDFEYTKTNSVFPIIVDGFDKSFLLFGKKYYQITSNINNELNSQGILEPGSGEQREVDEGQFFYSEFQNGIVTEGTYNGSSIGAPISLGEFDPSWKKMHAVNFSHPYSNFLFETILKYGIDGLLMPEKYDESIATLIRQDASHQVDLALDYKAQPDIIDNTILTANIDFTPSGAYSLYNWEMFFHIPIFIANSLANNGKHEEAMKWYHYVFNPSTYDPKITSGTGIDETEPQKYWRFKPFYDFYAYDNVNSLYDLFTDEAYQEELDAQIELMESDPFNPHIIAQFRIVAYMKSVVMKYIDNLVAWGDKLFARDTMESINEATQLYVLAARILGPKPQMVEGLEPADLNFGDIDWDEFGNAMIEVEQILAQVKNDYPEVSYLQSRRSEKQMRKAFKMTRTGMMAVKKVTTNQLYFCLMPNDKLLGYWGTVADRLFKIRNCMNLKGVVRTLPMFEPPIDPAALIKAKAAGIDLSTALDGMFAPMPKYRYRYIYHKASELVNEVKSLGAAILQAIEKRDGEELALIRSNHAIEMSKLMIDIRKKSIEETTANLESLTVSKESTAFNRDFYKNRKPRIEKEKRNLDLLNKSKDLQTSIVGVKSIAAVSALVPDFTGGMSGIGPHVVSLLFGGEKTSKAGVIAGDLLNQIQSFLQSQASIASINAGYQRRDEEWGHQASMADFEISRIDKQIAATELRLAISEKELDNLTKQIEQSEEELELMTTKFSNKQLYNWMIGQLSNLYNQSYQMALNVAKQAEKTYTFELDKDANFIGYEYWDSLKKGLLAGEKLQRDLHRMDVSFMENNERKHEITKHVSLAMVNAYQLNKLRQTGTCTFDVPELLFDIDFPGHYNRKIKSVSLTIPAVTGPYTSPTCFLLLDKNYIRKDTSNYNILDENDYNGATHFAYSQGQNDNGVFTFNFNDERYLPFEGAGAISQWTLNLPGKFRQFDYDTISDVILTINYTADYDGGLKSDAEDNIQNNINAWLDETGSTDEGIYRVFSLKAEFPNEFHVLQKDEVNTGTPDSTDLIPFELTIKHFPSFLQSYLEQDTTNKKIKIYRIEFYKKDLDESNGLFVNSVSSEPWGNSDAGYELCQVDFTSANNLLVDISSSDIVNLYCNFTKTPDDIIMIVKFKLEA